MSREEYNVYFILKTGEKYEMTISEDIFDDFWNNLFTSIENQQQFFIGLYDNIKITKDLLLFKSDYLNTNNILAYGYKII
jgi:hypothetical protein